MLIRKPTKQAIAYRFFQHRKRFYISLCSMFFFPFDRPRDIETEQEMWPYAAGKLAPFALEEGLPKGAAEVLVIGDCHAPGGSPVHQSHVGVQLGGIAKRLRVTGPRRWRRRWDNVYQAGAPEAFTALPVTWKTAFGGQGFERNPQGCGFVPEGIAADGTVLPSIEYDADPVADPDSRPRPAGFAPIPQDWPQRMRRVGSYDAAYYRGGHFPALASDIDFKAFNLAPADQWQKDWFAGDERFAIENMHPERPQIAGRLPQIRARCFLRDRDAQGGSRFREVPQNLDTVWLFPGDLRGIVAYRGTAEIGTAMGDDIEHLLFAYERLGTPPRSLAHYRTELDRRVDPKASAALLVYDAGLKPEDEGDPPPDPRLVVRFKDFRKDPAPALAALLAAQEGIVQQAAQAVGTSLAALQAAASRVLPPDVTALDDLVIDFNNPAAIDDAAIRAKVDAAAGSIRAKVDAVFEERSAARDALVQETRERMQAHGQDYDAFERQMAAKAGLPAAQIWAEGKEQYFAANQPFVEKGEEYRELFAELRKEADKVDSQVAELDAMRREGERAMGHVLALPAAPSPAQAAFARAALEEALAKGQPVADLPLAGLDLAGMDFTGRDLAGADFRGANLRGAVFARAGLQKASFAQADIAEADFTAADLTGANLAKTSAARAIFAGANLTDANCGEMAGPRTSFARATLVGTGLGKAGLPHADFSGARLQDLTMAEGDLTDARFPGAQLSQVTFTATPLVRTDFTEAHLQVVLVQQAPLDDAVFERARLEQFGVQGERSSLRRCRFAGAAIATCSLRGMDMAGADFTEALADGVDFSATAMDGTRFDRAVARGALFTGARITRSSFAGGNFAQSVWVEAHVGRTDFTGAVLYGSNFLRAAMEDNAFDRANLARSTLAGFALT